MWLAEKILNTCDAPLCKNVRDWLVGMSIIELDGPLVIKLIPDIVIDVYNITLHLLTHNIENLKMKEISGEFAGTAVSYLKGPLMILQILGEIPTNTMGLMNTIMCLADRNDFT